jgi:hypothetical protein
MVKLDAFDSEKRKVNPKGFEEPPLSPRRQGSSPPTTLPQRVTAPPSGPSAPWRQLAARYSPLMTASSRRGPTAEALGSRISAVPPGPNQVPADFADDPKCSVGHC